MPLRPLLALVLLPAACAGPDGPADSVPPALAVLHPERGAVAGSAIMTVSGTVSDDRALDSVVVNGVEATIEPGDGADRFSVDIELGPGTNLIETVATDAAGNVTVDVRGALHGTFAAPGAIDQAIAVRLGKSGLQAIGDTAAATLAAADLDADLSGVNPVLDTGGSCLGARADITSIDVGAVGVELATAGGELVVSATLDDVAVGVHVDFDVACIGGRRDLVVTADRLVVDASLEVGVAGGALVIDATSSEVTLDGVDLGLGGVPTAIIDLIAGDLDADISRALSSVLADELEPRVEAALATLGAERDIEVLGATLSVSIRPQAVDLFGGALVLSARSEVRAAGAATTGYVASPGSIPAIAGELAATVSDDALNQAVGALWAAGALSRDVELVGESGADLGGGIADSVSIDALLPPQVSFAGDRGARVEIADLVVTLGRDGSPVSEIAAALTIDLELASAGGQLRLRAGEPEVVLQLLSPGGFLTERDLDIIRALLATTLRGDLDALVGELPLPSIGAAAIESVHSRGETGYLILDVALAPVEGN